MVASLVRDDSTRLEKLEMKYFANRAVSVAILSLVMLSACKAEAPKQSTSEPTPVSETITTYLPASIPLRKQLSCVPKEAAFVAAHRGTSKKKDLAENSGSSLKALIDRGILMAEVDVAGLKDGTHILFHDGVWEDKTTGKGVVAATTWDEAKDFLLKDTDGDFSADRLITLTDALNISKDRIYLEIDFKSSAKYGAVIKSIRQADMADQVILIAYSNKQARKLSSMAPEMLLSIGAKSEADIKALQKLGVKKGNMTIWRGRGPYESGFIGYLDGENIPVLAWPNEGFDRDAAAAPATVMVTDYALQKRSIEGLTPNGQKAYKACLAADSN